MSGFSWVLFWTLQSLWLCIFVCMVVGELARTEYFCLNAVLCAISFPLLASLWKQWTKIQELDLLDLE